MPAEPYMLPWVRAPGAPGKRPYIGTSGWSYRSWQKTVLPGVPLKKRLPHLSRMFNAVEVNGSFYGQVARKTYEAWRAATEPGFRFSVKGHRFVTHYKRLLDCAEPVRRLREQAEGLADKLAVVLWQLPAHFAANLDRLDGFLAVLDREWPDTRHALELRHASWFTGYAGQRRSGRPGHGPGSRSRRTPGPQPFLLPGEAGRTGQPCSGRSEVKR